MKTVKELKDFIAGLPDNTRVIINSWDCHNDEPYDREVRPYITGTSRKVLHL